VLDSNPNAYIWAGRDFHQRPQQGINDYFWIPDSPLRTFEGLADLEFAAVAFVAQAADRRGAVIGTNVLDSNPNAYIWAGRDFHQRPQQGINDYFWMNHDGSGRCRRCRNCRYR
jgi:maltoporin